MATRPTAETPSREDQLMELTLQLRNEENAKKYAQFHGDSLISNKTPDKVGLLEDLTAALAPSNWGALGDIVGSFLSGKPVDEAGLAQVSGSLSNDSTNRERLINDQVRKKYDKMLHPPLTYLGDAFQYRTADGSFNSALNPHLGQAGGPYAKTVPSKTAPLGALPDPEVLFDRLMAREAGGRQSQSGLSSMLLYHATIIIHDIFRTNDDDKNISDSSSYLDLSPLYGYNESMVRKVRDDKYKLGLLKPDTFAEDRLLRQPPGVCIMLVMYNRYHNYAARQLLRINENGRFSLPKMYSGTRLVALIKEHLPDRDDQGVKMPLDSKVNLLCNQYEDLWGKVRAARPPDAPDAPKKQDSETPEQTAVREAAEKKRKAALDLITAFESELLYTKFADVERQLKQKLKEKGNKLERESPALLKSFEKKCKDFKMAWQAAWDKQDDDLFNTARLITQGMYVNISIHDYLRTLMGFHQFDTNFTLDPRKDFDQKKTTRGLGNQVTVEFNLLYRFHCAISLRDEKYTEDYMKAKLGIEHPEHLSLPEFLKVMSYEKQKGTKPVEPWQVTFGIPDVPAPKTTPGSKDGHSTERSRNNSDSGISLGSTGVDVDITKAKAPAVATPSVANSKHFERNEITNLFDDEQMLNELTAAMDEPLSNFGPRNVPKCLKPVEMMGIMQARKWEVGTLNDFRSFFELPVHTTFESVSANPDIQNALRDLYESPDKIELYPGIFCEGDAKMSLDPGPAESSPALWAAIFSDAITLVRSDRFYTVDWNTQSLTAWGMKEVTPDNDVCKSSVFHRLTQRAFPGWLPRDSLRWFNPFYTAKQNAIYAEQQGYASQFKDTAKIELMPYFDRAKAAARIVACPPEKPQKPCYLDNFEDIKVVLKDQSDHFTNPVFSYKSNLPRALREVLDRETARPIKFDPNILKKHVKSVEKELKTYLSELMTSIIKRESVSITKAEFQIDATRDFAIPVVTRYMAAFLGFSHKLREVPATCTVSDKRTQTAAHPGTYTENEIYQHITNCQVFLAYNTDETKWMARRTAFQKSVEKLIELARQGTIWEAKQLFGLSNMLIGKEETNPMHQMGVFVAKQVLKHEPDQTRAAAILLLISLDFTYNAVVSFTATLDGFMEDLYQVANGDNMEAEPKWLALQRAALVDEDNVVEKMVLDMARAKVNLPIVRKVLKKGQFKFVGVPYKGKSTTLKEGQHVVLDLAPATASAVEAQDTGRLKFLTLQLSIADKYAVFSPRDFIPLSQAQMIKFIALTRNTRRGPAAQGELKRVHLEATAEGYANYMAPERVEWIKEQVDKLEDQKEASRIFNDKIFVAGFDTFLTPSWDEYVPFPMTWKIRFDGFGKSDYIDQECKNVKYGQVRTVGKGLPDFCPPWYQPKGPSSTGGTFAMVECVCADSAASGCGCSGGKAGRKERAPKPIAMSTGCKVGP